MSSDEHALSALAQLALTVRRMRLCWLLLLREHLRSGRVVIDVVASLVFYVVLLRGETTIPGTSAFSMLASFFTVGLVFYVTTVMMNTLDRPATYVLLAHGVQRAELLCALIGSAMTVVTALYVLISTTTAFFPPAPGMLLVPWLMSSLPILLNATLASTFVCLLSPFIFPTGWRIGFLAIVAVAFSDSFVGRAGLDAAPETVRSALLGAQTIVSWPLMPAFSGFAVAMTPQTLPLWPTVVAQTCLVLALVSLAAWSFSRRELLLQTEAA